MRNLLTFGFISTVFLCGLVLIFRGCVNPEYLPEIKERVLEKRIELVSARSKGYAVIFKIANHEDKAGVYVGTEQQAADTKLVSLIDTGKVYSFFIDPIVWPSNGVNLGVKEIRFGNNIIYRESSLFNLFFGTFCILLSTGVFFSMRRNK